MKFRSLDNWFFFFLLSSVVQHRAAKDRQGYVPEKNTKQNQQATINANSLEANQNPERSHRENTASVCNQVSQESVQIVSTSLFS